MAWRIVKQPNGFYARFSDIVDNFTHMNMTEDEAHTLCRGFMGEDEARRKVRAGVEDWKPWTEENPGNGSERWDDSLETIQMVHGETGIEEVLAALERASEGTIML